MPTTGDAGFREDGRASWFPHKSETSKPFYYSVYLADHDVTTDALSFRKAAIKLEN